MNTHKLKLAALVLCGVVLSPLPSHAASAIQLSDTSALFSIDFTFNDSSFATEVPVTTKLGAKNADRIDDVGYSIQKRISAEHNPITTVSSIILAPSAPIVNGRYQVAKGSSQTFTLLIVATFTNPLADDYQALITKLPYFLDGRRTTLHQNQHDTIAPSVLTIE